MKAEASQFVPQALRVIKDAVVQVIGMTNLHVRKTPLPLRLASRARSRLKALEQMLRSVITLMALGLLGQVHARASPLARIRALDGMPTKLSRTHSPRPPAKKDPYLPAYRGGGCGDVDFSSLPKGVRRGPVPLHKLVARIITLQRVLENPEPSARRLAIHYARLKNLNASPSPPRPIPLRRASAELALVAGALPMELTRALVEWHDTS